MSQHPLSLSDQSTGFLLYTASNGSIKVEVLLGNETIWLTQKRMAELFGVGVPAVSKHLKNIFDSGQLQEERVISILETSTAHGAVEGLTQLVDHGKLDAAMQRCAKFGLARGCKRARHIQGTAAPRI